MLRSAILPLDVETGRYLSLEEGKRTCSLFLNEIENEFRFVFYCTFYRELHDTFSKIKTNIDFVNIDDPDRLSCLFIYETFKLASYLEKTWERKQAFNQDNLWHIRRV